MVSVIQSDSRYPGTRPGDTDLSQVGAAMADPTRCRILLALLDGRALAASVLAAEAGVSASTASGHLGRLTAAGFLTVERHGRHRYYRLAGPAVAALLEAAAQLAPPQPVRSLRDGTRASALRNARVCYDHLAGRLGVAVMRALLRDGHLSGHDGTFDPSAARADRLSARGRDHVYHLTPAGNALLHGFGIHLPPAATTRYCVDWSEQHHHLSGQVGRAILTRMFDLRWLERPSAGRWLRITRTGAAGLLATFTIPEADWRAPN